MKLSVIIPTLNRERLLQKALDSISMQTLDQALFEVIVVDNGSKDNTKFIVDNFMSKIRNLVYIYDENPGLHVGRHRGLFAAKADILVYCDDDIEAFPTWLEGVIESFEDESVALVGGKNLPKFEIEPPSWLVKMWDEGAEKKVIYYLSLLDLGNEIKEIEPHYVFGCNFSIRRKILLEAGGFHPDGMPQELMIYRGDGETHIANFLLKKGYKTIYNPKASVYHVVTKERMTKEYFAHRAFKQGISDSYTDIRENRKRNIKKSQVKIFLKKLLGKETFLEEQYLKGYCYHQNLAQKDPKLMEWIKRESYIYNVKYYD